MPGPYFSETLRELIGYSIGIFSKDGVLLKGSLVEVKEDYLILQNEKEEHFYHHLNQIKSISKNTKDFQLNKINHNYMQAEKLQEILELCKRRWVTINCYQDQVLTGFLSKVFDDHLILISGEEKVIIQNSYISTIFSGCYEEIHSNVTNKSNENEAAITNEAAADNTAKDETAVISEAEAIDNAAKDETAVISKAEAIDGAAKDETAVTHETEAPVRLEVRQHQDEIEPKEELDDDQVDLVNPSFEAIEEEAKEINTTAESTSQKSRTEKSSFREKEIEEMDYTLFDRKLRSNLIARKKRAQLPREEESNSSAKKNKKLKYSKKKERPQAEEKQEFAQPVLTQEEKERILETQYYSLMKHAEKAQHYSLMKQAQRDYMKLKEKRMQRERVKQ